jgi:hypothetical protein
MNLRIRFCRGWDTTCGGGEEQLLAFGSSYRNAMGKGMSSTRTERVQRDFRLQPLGFAYLRPGLADWSCAAAPRLVGQECPTHTGLGSAYGVAEVKSQEPRAKSPYSYASASMGSFCAALNAG